MKSTFFFLITLLLLILFSCSHQSQPSKSDTEETLGMACDQLKSYEDFKSRMDVITRERLVNLEMIKNNIIGEWGLIGAQPAWVPIDPGAECIHLTISETTIIMKDLSSGAESTIAYEIKPYSENSIGAFFLSTTEEDAAFPILHYQLGMTEFSEKYMFGSGKNYADGTTYVYEKLQ